MQTAFELERLCNPEVYKQALAVLERSEDVVELDVVDRKERIEALLYIIFHCGDYHVQFNVLGALTEDPHIAAYQNWFATAWFNNMPLTKEAFLNLPLPCPSGNTWEVRKFLNALNLETTEIHIISIKCRSASYDDCILDPPEKNDLWLDVNMGSKEMTMCVRKTSFPKPHLNKQATSPSAKIMSLTFSGMEILEAYYYFVKLPETASPFRQVVFRLKPRLKLAVLVDSSVDVNWMEVDNFLLSTSGQNLKFVSEEEALLKKQHVAYSLVDAWVDNGPHAMENAVNRVRSHGMQPNEERMWRASNIVSMETETSDVIGLGENLAPSDIAVTSSCQEVVVHPHGSSNNGRGHLRQGPPTASPEMQQLKIERHYSLPADESDESDMGQEVDNYEEVNNNYPENPTEGYKVNAAPSCNGKSHESSYITYTRDIVTDKENRNVEAESEPMECGTQRKKLVPLETNSNSKRGGYKRMRSNSEANDVPGVCHKQAKVVSNTGHTFSSELTITEVPSTKETKTDTEHQDEENKSHGVCQEKQLKANVDCQDKESDFIEEKGKSLLKTAVVDGVVTRGKARMKRESHEDERDDETNRDSTIEEPGDDQTSKPAPAASQSKKTSVPKKRAKQAPRKSLSNRKSNQLPKKTVEASNIGESEIEFTLNVEELLNSSVETTVIAPSPEHPVNMPDLDTSTCMPDLNSFASLPELDASVGDENHSKPQDMPQDQESSVITSTPSGRKNHEMPEAVPICRRRSSKSFQDRRCYQSKKTEVLCSTQPLNRPPLPVPEQTMPNHRHFESTPGSSPSELMDSSIDGIESSVLLLPLKPREFQDKPSSLLGLDDTAEDVLCTKSLSNDTGTSFEIMSSDEDGGNTLNTSTNLILSSESVGKEDTEVSRVWCNSVPGNIVSDLDSAKTLMLLHNAPVPKAVSGPNSAFASSFDDLEMPSNKDTSINDSRGRLQTESTYSVGNSTMVESSFYSALSSPVE